MAITAKLAHKPYLEIPQPLYEKLAKEGKKTVKISVLHQIKNEKNPDEDTRMKKLQIFADKTLGIWADDSAIEKAFNDLEGRWQLWRDETLL